MANDHGEHDHKHTPKHPGRRPRSHPSRRQVIGSATAAGLSLPLSGLAGSGLGWAATAEVARDMARAAGAWLAQLDDRQRALAQLAWSSPRRGDWHYVPRARVGLPLRQMSPAQTAAAWDVLGSLLSARGREQVGALLRLERILGDMTRNPVLRDPGNYALVVFGDPAGAGPWAWRFEGHHLSLTAVVAPEHGVGVTPVFFGANPAKVPAGHAHAGFRLLGPEEDAVFGLVRSLKGGARTEAVITDRSLGDIVSGPGREHNLQRPEGVPLARLNEAQRTAVMRFLELYVGTMRQEVAGPSLARIREAGIDGLHFAWAGSLAPGQPHYFRVHGPTVLVEYDNTQNGANHVHSVWIDPQGVFGRDLLRAHYQGAH
jgi:Protein of unknown function (DUF3500)